MEIILLNVQRIQWWCKWNIFAKNDKCVHYVPPIPPSDELGPTVVAIIFCPNLANNSSG